jgi:phenylacetate-coenzyme A ligase PaaK-like adenylate-forming protein
MDIKNYCSQIFSINTHSKFEEIAMEAFDFQYKNNIVYQNYCNLIKCDIAKIKQLTDIPFLPISLFKTHKIISKHKSSYDIFTSSSTSGSSPSKHYVADLDIYKKSFLNSFGGFYGQAKDYVFLALLPSYLERSGSSLVYMMQELITLSEKPESGFFLNEFEKLKNIITELEQHNRKYILMGVSFALLDFAEKYKMNIHHGIIMETGGMKGKRKELVRDELHRNLTNSFGVSKIHSEYGMTELLSQAYSDGYGLFNCPTQMKVLIREVDDVRAVRWHGSGALNIIDLANIYSCCFIETSDLGTVNPDDSFTISGRFDYADVRGCNLMIV